MKKPMLKTIRLLAPGIIILLCLLPFLNLEATKTLSESVSGIVWENIVVIGAILLGAIYYSFDCRGLLWRAVVKKCHDNVFDTIIEPHYQDPIVSTKLSLITNKVVMRIFYNIIDNDPSLSDQADDVRMNGVILSTAIDGILLLPVFTLLYFIVFCVSSNTLFLHCALAALMVQVILWLARPRLTRKHLDLQNEQLAVINQHHIATVLNRLQNL